MGKSCISMKHLIQQLQKTVDLWIPPEEGGWKVSDGFGFFTLKDFLNLIKTNLDLMDLYLDGFVSHGFIFCNLMDFSFSQEEDGLRVIM